MTRSTPRIAYPIDLRHLRHLPRAVREGPLWEGTETGNPPATTTPPAATTSPASPPTATHEAVLAAARAEERMRWLRELGVGDEEQAKQRLQQLKQLEEQHQTEAERKVKDASTQAEQRIRSELEPVIAELKNQLREARVQIVILEKARDTFRPDVLSIVMREAAGHAKVTYDETTGKVDGVEEALADIGKRFPSLVAEGSGSGQAQGQGQGTGPNHSSPRPPAGGTGGGTQGAGQYRQVASSYAARTYAVPASVSSRGGH